MKKTVQSNHVVAVDAENDAKKALDLLASMKTTTQKNIQQPRVDPQVEKNTATINYLEGEIKNMDSRINAIGAMAAANASLFQPYGVGRVNVTAGVGHYDGANAVSVGMGYRMNQNFAIKGSISANDTGFRFAASSFAIGAAVGWEF